MWAVGKYIGELRSADPEPFFTTALSGRRWHVVNNDIAIEDWFDDLGKIRVSLTAGYEFKGLRFPEIEDVQQDFWW